MSISEARPADPPEFMSVDEYCRTLEAEPDPEPARVLDLSKLPPKERREFVGQQRRQEAAARAAIERMGRIL